jgi:formamidopyrimidine-DNA glycosylase
LQQAVFKKPHRTIKETIMDGNVVAGIGNMYASEALFRSRIDPAAPAGILSPRHLELLVEHIIETLKVALQEGEEFIKRVDSQNTSPGHFDVSLLVYGREGKSCGTCGSTIRRIIIGGRATFFCPRCQEMPDFPLFEA